MGITGRPCVIFKNEPGKDNKYDAIARIRIADEREYAQYMDMKEFISIAQSGKYGFKYYDDGDRDGYLGVFLKTTDDVKNFQSAYDTLLKFRTVDNTTDNLKTFLEGGFNPKK